VTTLVGPIGAGPRLWRRWAKARQLDLVTADDRRFPVAAWLRSLAERHDLPAAAVRRMARRAGRDPAEFLAAWRVKTGADRRQFWTTLEPEADDEHIQKLTTLAISACAPACVASSLDPLGASIVSTLTRLVPAAEWPCILFVARSLPDLASAGEEAASWAIRTPGLLIAIDVQETVWGEFLASAPESRTKAILKEGEITVPTLDAEAVRSALREANAPETAIIALSAIPADSALVAAASAAVRAARTPPASEHEDDRARSAAERFLFDFLESLPETAGKFELNGALDFTFGTSPAEVDLLCRSMGIAIELDGYFHFLNPERYRRDRAKDWELQRRRFLVLRFLAQDVIPQLELIRDRILDAVVTTRSGASP
jgi:hypothetical protein